MDAAFRLSVDVGTCHTVAVVRRGDESPRALLFDGSPLLPSGVFVGADGEVVVGRDAERMSQVDASRFEPFPKRQVDDGVVLLGDRTVPVVDLLAGILRRVAQEARIAGVDPVDASVLTCPADWGGQRRALLQSAAQQAGFGSVAMVDEPVAAASYCRSVLGQEISPGGCLVVFDFGGGTLDVSVVRAGGEAFEVLAVGGLDDLGGVDFDAALVGHLGQLIEMRDGAAWGRLCDPVGSTQLRNRRAFWTEVRGAKEMLSRGSMAPVVVPGTELALHLTRVELERVVGPLVDRAVDETRRVLQRAGIGTAGLGGILLVGGTSRTPLVASRLHARFKVAPTVPEQPELPVAFGGLLAAAAQRPSAHATPPQDQGDSPQPAPAADALLMNPLPPISAPPAFPASPQLSFPASAPPVSPAAAGSAAPVSAAPVSAGPVPAAPVSASPSSGFPRPQAAAGSAADGAPQVYGHAEWLTPKLPPVLPPPMGPIGRRPVKQGRFGLAKLLVPILVIALVSTSGLWGQNLFTKFGQAITQVTGGGGLTGSSGNGKKLTKVANMALPGEGTAAVELSDEMVYAGSVSTTETLITATKIGSAEPSWSAKLGMLPVGLRMRLVGTLLVVDGDRSVNQNNDNVRAVLDAASGATLWGPKVWKELRDLAYLDTDALVEQTEGLTATSTQRIDLKTGNIKWSKPGPKDLYLAGAHLSSVARVWPSAEPGAATVLSDDDMAENFTESLAFDGASVVQIRDAKGENTLVYNTDNGAVRKSAKTNIDEDKWTVYDGLVIGQVTDSNRVAAFGLDNLVQRWEKPWPAGVSFGSLRGCGPKLVCVVTSASGKKVLTALNTADGTEAWHRDFDSSDDPACAVLAKQLVVGTGWFKEIEDPYMADPATGSSAHSFGTKSYAVKGRGAKVALTGADGGGWHLAIGDVTDGSVSGGGDLGAEQPESTAVSANAVAAVTKDHHLLVFRT